MKTRDRLRIAIQKSGRLGTPTRELLARVRGWVLELQESGRT